jgi:WD40 repeat protein
MLTTVHNKYLVAGYSNGHIKFYDFDFKIIAWFDDLGFSEIKSISFSNKNPIRAENKMPDMLKDALANNKKDKNADDPSKDQQDELQCSDFLVADVNALILTLKASIFEAIKGSAENRGFTIMCGITGTICGVAVHPDEPMLAIAGSEGSILLWNYEKQDEPRRNFEKIPKDDSKVKGDGVFRCIEFVPDGQEILVGMHDGVIAVMDPSIGQFKKFNNDPSTSVEGGKPINQIVVTDDSKFFACHDAENAVCLFYKDKNSQEWKLASK